MSPLYIASEKDHVEVAKVLLEYGPQVNLPSNVRPVLQYRFSYYLDWTNRLLQVVIQFKLYSTTRTFLSWIWPCICILHASRVPY